jgi:hypothetical protein
MTPLLPSVPGPLPLTTTYTSQGGALLFYMSGSAWCMAGGQPIGINLVVDGNVVGTAKVFTNEGWSHKSLVANGIVVKGLPAGTHKVQITQTWSSLERTDYNDYFDLTVVEVVPDPGTT